MYEGRILHRGRIISAEVGVGEDGRILRVAPAVPGGKRVSFGESLILPSATDLHVHFRDPGPTGSIESFETGTLQAALGGVGAVVDMPNTLPPTTNLARLEEKMRRVVGRSYVDVLLLAALVPGARVEPLARVASGFKLYLSPTTGDLPTPSLSERRELFEQVAAAGSAVHVHAEDPALFPPHSSPANAEGWDRARPTRSELSAVESLLPPPPNLLLHLAHATTVAAVEKARAAGLSTEATPHHLLLSATAGEGARFKVNPPLRSSAQRRELFEAFRDGKVTMLASDHAPHPAEEKDRPFAKAPSGVPGVETLLPLMLARVRAGDLSLGTLVAAACRRPAMFLGLPRGQLAPGLEANFLVVDFRQGRTIRGRELHAPCGWTPFEGLEGVFPREHYLRGQRVVEDGEFVGAHGGRCLRRGALGSSGVPP